MKLAIFMTLFTVSISAFATEPSIPTQLRILQQLLQSGVPTAQQKVQIEAFYAQAKGNSNSVFDCGGSICKIGSVEYNWDRDFTQSIGVEVKYLGSLDRMEILSVRSYDVSEDGKQ